MSAGSSEAFRSAVRARLAADGLVPSSWTNGAGDRYAPHAHDYDKVLVVVAGSIAFELLDLGRTEDLALGDRLELPAGTVHAALVGPDGVTCLEAHLPRGALPAAPRSIAAWERPPGSG